MRASILGAAFLAAFALGAHAQTQGPIRIGEINSYKAQAAFLEPYRKGMDLAVQEINAAGGVNGRKLEVVTRDDGGNPGDAVRNAEELLSREKVDFLVGGFLSNIGVALTDFAKQNKVFFLASEPLTNKIVWDGGNRYTFRLRPSTYMQVKMLIPEAVAAKKKRWALVYPNYEYGQSAVATFKELLKARQPDVEFVSDQATPLGKIDAGVVTQAISDAKPDAIFNVLFGADLAKFVREGETRDLFKDKTVVSLLTGEPEYIDPLKAEAPVGWYVTGYPWYAIKTPEHDKFLAAYQKQYNDYPRIGSIVGYTAIQAVAAGVKKAGSTDTNAMINAFEGLEFMSPFGKVMFRKQDHQSTLGAYVGKTAVKDGKGVMVDFSYKDGSDFQPTDEEVKKLRPAD
ncbi:MAG: ABC transporter substrate-binding protein [Hyphomicrobiales bacterium]|nr:ABC transporter substrate-binding protein [Hyphomicrobiales bacterium]